MEQEILFHYFPVFTLKPYHILCALTLNQNFYKKQQIILFHLVPECQSPPMNLLCHHLYMYIQTHTHTNLCLNTFKYSQLSNTGLSTNRWIDTFILNHFTVLCLDRLLSSVESSFLSRTGPSNIPLFSLARRLRYAKTSSTAGAAAPLFQWGANYEVKFINFNI